MRRFELCLASATLALSGCAPGSGLQSTAQECRAEQASALSAEYPNAALLGQHDQLEQDAAIMRSQAEQAYRNTGDPDAGTVEIGQAVQDSEDADGLYNFRERQQSAAQSWQMLDGVAGDEQAQWARLQQQNADDYAATQAQAVAQSEPDPAMTAPAPPPAEPTPNLYSPPPAGPKDLHGHPICSGCPPALQTEAVGEGGPAVPPVAQ